MWSIILLYGWLHCAIAHGPAFFIGKTTLSVSEYSKPYLSVAQQVELLRSRGMLISDTPRAESLPPQNRVLQIKRICLSFPTPRN